MHSISHSYQCSMVTDVWYGTLAGAIDSTGSSEVK